MSKVIIEWVHFKAACFHTARKINEDNISIDAIIGLSRGGLVPARIMAEYLNPKKFYVLGLSLYDDMTRGNEVTVYQDLPMDINWDEFNNVLIIDDVSDGGTTLRFAVKHMKKTAPKLSILTATPYIKTGTGFIPSYYVTEYPKDQWIVFPFEEA